MTEKKQVVRVTIEVDESCNRTVLLSRTGRRQIVWEVLTRGQQLRMIHALRRTAEEWERHIKKEG